MNLTAKTTPDEARTAQIGRSRGVYEQEQGGTNEIWKGSYLTGLGNVFEYF